MREHEFLFRFVALSGRYIPKLRQLRHLVSYRRIRVPLAVAASFARATTCRMLCTSGATDPTCPWIGPEGTRMTPRRWCSRPHFNAFIVSLGRSDMNKFCTATLAAALVTASIPSLTTTAEARSLGFHGGGFHGGGWGHGGWGHGGWGHRGWGWGWGGAGLGLAAGALIGAAIAAPYYSGYGCPYGYGYGYDCDYGYGYGYGYAPVAYSYGYAPAISYGYGYRAPYRIYGHRHYGYRAGYGGYAPRVGYAGYGRRGYGGRVAYGGVRAAHVGFRGTYARGGYGGRMR